MTGHWFVRPLSICPTVPSDSWCRLCHRRRHRGRLDSGLRKRSSQSPRNRTRPHPLATGRELPRRRLSWEVRRREEQPPAIGQPGCHGNEAARLCVVDSPDPLCLHGRSRRLACRQRRKRQHGTNMLITCIVLTFSWFLVCSEGLTTTDRFPRCRFKNERFLPHLPTSRHGGRRRSSWSAWAPILDTAGL